MPPEVKSREYKIMLQASKFAGADAQLVATSQQFWREFTDAVSEDGLTTDGAFVINAKKRRGITFYDTRDRHLNNADVLFRDYIFRKRVRSIDGRTDVTLKYRHPMRLVTEDRKMDPSSALKKPKTKLEQDIKAVNGRVRSLYSFSGTGRMKPDTEITQLADVVALFPNLGRHVGAKPKEPLAPVAGFTAAELVLDGATFQLGTDRPAECALVVWYDPSHAEAHPIIAEFSFRHMEARETDFTVGEAKATYTAFRRAVALTAWASPDATTKTDYVYGLA